MYKKYDRIAAAAHHRRAGGRRHLSRASAGSTSAARYTLVNKTHAADQRPARGHGSRRRTMSRARFAGATLAKNDADARLLRSTTSRSRSRPARRCRCRSRSTIRHHGLRERAAATTRSSTNGTFFNNFATFPHLGYSPNVRAAGPQQAPQVRPRAGRARMAKIDDPKARTGQRHLRATPTGSISTRRSAPSPDQIALAPGYLQKEWTANGRRYFHYKMDRADPRLLRLPVGALRR